MRQGDKENLYERLFSISPHLCCVAGSDGFFRELNPAWEKALGYTREELLAKPWLEFVHPDDRPAAAALRGRLDGRRVVIAVTIAEGLDKPYFDRQGVIWIKTGSDRRRIQSKEELRRLFQMTDQFHADELPTKAGIDKLDPAAIRDAANKARSMAAMLGDDQQAAVEGAIEQARKAARQIVKRVQKEGEAAAIVLADVQRGAIEKARIAFLDLDGDHMTSTALPAVQQQRFADLDLSVADKELI